VDLCRLQGGVAEGVRENGEEANERGEGFPDGSQVYKRTRCARSTVNLGGCDWAPWVASRDGIMVRVQGYRWCCRWRAGSVGSRPFSERWRSVWVVAGSSRCTSGLGSDGVVTASGCHAGMRGEGNWTGRGCTGTRYTRCALWAVRRRRLARSGLRRTIGLG
jgi:hypothetical protein